MNSVPVHVQKLAIEWVFRHCVAHLAYPFNCIAVAVNKAEQNAISRHEISGSAQKVFGHIVLLNRTGTGGMRATGPV